jgi:hypothetical protein
VNSLEWTPAYCHAAPPVTISHHRSPWHRRVPDCNCPRPYNSHSRLFCRLHPRTSGSRRSDHSVRMAAGAAEARWRGLFSGLGTSSRRGSPRRLAGEATTQAPLAVELLLAVPVCGEVGCEQVPLTCQRMLLRRSRADYDQCRQRAACRFIPAHLLLLERSSPGVGCFFLAQARPRIPAPGLLHLLGEAHKRALGHVARCGLRWPGWSECGC